jgi:hypothetical protein
VVERNLRLKPEAAALTLDVSVGAVQRMAQDVRSPNVPQFHQCGIDDALRRQAEAKKPKKSLYVGVLQLPVDFGGEK